MKHLLLSIAAVFIVTACANKPPEKPTIVVLDHFKCYKSSGRPLEQKVILKDQFGKAEVIVLDPARFCNPVQKVYRDKVTPIAHRDHHLVFYAIKSKVQLPEAIRVTVDNQFGRQQRMTLTEPMFLAVPTQKLSPGDHPPPKGLDHFKCYQAEGNPIQATISLKDQFRSDRRANVHKPFVLCNPVAKIRETHVSEILHPKAHLMCYLMDRLPYDGEVKFKNQFGSEGLKLQQADMLCVPSVKHRIR